LEVSIVGLGVAANCSDVVGFICSNRYGLFQRVSRNPLKQVQSGQFRALSGHLFALTSAGARRTMTLIRAIEAPTNSKEQQP